ncbi:MAG: disulfide bond formation protein B [Candidatus Paceibacterota bacterium]
MDIILNKTFSVFTLLLQVFIFIGFLYFLFPSFRQKRYFKQFYKFLLNKYFKLSFLIVLGATLGSLFYSEIVGLPPCDLCWYQRIFIYPQVLILGFAIYKKEDKVLLDLTLLTSFIGLLLAGYHYLIQMTGSDSFFCDPSSSVANCSNIQIMELGYITMPMMSFTVFLFLLVFGLLRRKFSKDIS